MAAAAAAAPPPMKRRRDVRLVAGGGGGGGSAAHDRALEKVAPAKTLIFHGLLPRSGLFGMPRMTCLVRITMRLSGHTGKPVADPEAAGCR